MSEVVNKIELSRYTTNAMNIQKKSLGYIPNGFDNLFSNYLDGLYVNSPTHQSVVDDLTGYIIGKGLISDNPEDEENIKRFFNKKFLTKLEKFRKIHSAVCLLVVRNALYRIIDIEVVNPSQIRVVDVKRGKPCLFKYKKTWDEKVNTYSWNTGEEIPVYDKFSKESLIYWYDSGVFDLPYGRPSYLSATDPIEFEISLYTGDNHGAQNGTTPSAFGVFPSSGDAEEDRKALKAMQSNLSGVANKGKFAAYFHKAGDAPTNPITLLNDNSRESKKVNYEVAESGILKGWRIPSPTLISGLNIKPTGFGDAEAEMQWALNTLKTKIIEPERDELIEILKPLFAELQVSGNVIFEEIKDRNIAAQVEVQEQVQVNENFKNLTGKQRQNIKGIIRDYKKGRITRKAAELSLKSGFAMTDEEVDAWLDDMETQLSKHLTLENIIEEANSIDTMFADGWRIESVEDAGGSADEERLLREESLVKLASTGTARPNSKTSQSGTKGDVQYKILYRYAGNQTGEREFCNKMLRANKLYRYEDIRNMSFSNVNAGFGRNGANNYDIFSYKGGPNCKHKWERVTFVKKGLEGGIDARSGTAQDNALKETQADNRGMTPKGTAKSKQRISETRPFDMPNRGYYRMAMQTLKKITNGN